MPPGTDSPLKRFDASTAPPVSANAVSDDKYRSLQRCLQPETQKSKLLKANTLSNLNLGRLCSSLLGMTCQLIPAAKQRQVLPRDDMERGESLTSGSDGWQGAHNVACPSEAQTHPFANLGRRAFVGLIDGCAHRSCEGSEVLKPSMCRAE